MINIGRVRKGRKLDINKACRGRREKYYATILLDNAAMALLARTSEAKAIETPGGLLVGYNVYRVDEFIRMEQDPFLPESIKLKLREHGPSLDGRFTSPSLEGWHVVRTPTPLAGSKLKAILTAIAKNLGSRFYSKSQGQLLTVRDSLVMEKVYEA